METGGGARERREAVRRRLGARLGEAGQAGGSLCLVVRPEALIFVQDEGANEDDAAAV